MFVKQSNYLDQSMKNIIQSSDFQKNFEITKLSSYEPNLKTAILQLIDLSDKMEKLGGIQASQKLLKIANEALEICGICGYDHGYDGQYSGVREKIEQAHAEDFELPFSDEDDIYSKEVEDKILSNRGREYSPEFDNFSNDCGDMSTLDGTSSINDGEEDKDPE